MTAITPITQHIFDVLGTHMARKTDASITEALDAKLGVGAWDLPDLAGRLCMVSSGTCVYQTLYLDGQPILRFHPMQFTHSNDGGSYTVKVTQKVERL